MKTYLVGTLLKSLIEALLMSTSSIYFHGEVRRKKIPVLFCRGGVGRGGVESAPAGVMDHIVFFLFRCLEQLPYVDVHVSWFFTISYRV